MHFVLKVNDMYAAINKQSKYTSAVKLTTSIELATVFNSVDEAANNYTKYLNDFRDVVSDIGNAVIKIQQVTINPTDDSITMPNLLVI